MRSIKLLSLLILVLFSALHTNAQCRATLYAITFDSHTLIPIDENLITVEYSFKKKINRKTFFSKLDSLVENQTPLDTVPDIFDEIRIFVDSRKKQLLISKHRYIKYQNLYYPLTKDIFDYIITFFPKEIRYKYTPWKFKRQNPFKEAGPK